MKKFVIVAGEHSLDTHGREKTEVLYWSITLGWSPTLEHASIFDEGERPFIAMPTGGKWLDITKELS